MSESDEEAVAGAATDNEPELGGPRFDAVAGLLSMLAVVGGERESGPPEDAVVRKVEGWILGQADGEPAGGAPGGKSCRSTSAV